MTTYGFSLHLDEQEFFAIKEAIDFFLTAEAAELRKTHNHLTKYAAEIRLRELIDSGKLYQAVEQHSGNNFGQLVSENAIKLPDLVNLDSIILAIVFEKLKSSVELSEMAEAASIENFFNNPIVSHLILGCILNNLENLSAKLKFECLHWLQDESSRAEMIEMIGKNIYDYLTDTKNKHQLLRSSKHSV